MTPSSAVNGAASRNVHTILSRRLYRNLLRAAKPFTSPSPIAKVLGSLLHRTGIDDHIHDWDKYIREPLGIKVDPNSSAAGTVGTRTPNEARDLSIPYYSVTRPLHPDSESSSTSESTTTTTTRRNADASLSHRTYTKLFRRLLREVVTAGTSVTNKNTYAKMVFPDQVDTERLRDVIRREFRARSALSTTGSNNNNNNNNKNKENLSEDDVVVPSSYFDDTVRIRVAMVALRELHKKLRYYDVLKQNAPTPHPNQAASNVSPLSLLSTPSSSSHFIPRPGCFLVSHPLLNDGYFTKSVICILSHRSNNESTHDVDHLEQQQQQQEATRLHHGNDSEEHEREELEIELSNMNAPRDMTDNDEGADQETLVEQQQQQQSNEISSPQLDISGPWTTYGVIVNRMGVNRTTGRSWTLREVFEDHMLPQRLADTFGNVPVHDGGPVHMSLQMLHTVTDDPSSSSSSTFILDSEEDVCSREAISGCLIPEIPADDNDDHDDVDSTCQRTALYSDRATYYKGNIFKAMDAINKGTLDRDDVSFFVGASTWTQGQLSAEIAQGFWRPMRGPTDIALHGMCEHDNIYHHTNDKTSSSSQSPIGLNTSLSNNNETPSNDDKEDSMITKSLPSTKRPLTDLWLSMMSSVGDDDTQLAHLFHHSSDHHSPWGDDEAGDNEDHEEGLGLACDLLLNEDDYDNDDDDDDDDHDITAIL